MAAPAGDARASAFMYALTTFGILPASASAVPVVSPTANAATINTASPLRMGAEASRARSSQRPIATPRPRSLAPISSVRNGQRLHR